MSGPRVSVVVTCYNYGRFLGECVDSVLGQTFRDYEIIIVDDASTDNTGDVAKGIIDANPGISIRLDVTAGLGFPESRNAGIREAKGEYIMPLDADDKLHPEYLARTVSVLDARPEVSFVYTDWELFGGDEGSQKHNPVDRSFDPDRLLYWNYIIGCSLFRRSAWSGIGGYKSEGIDGYYDWDFWLSIVEDGGKGEYVPGPYYLYRRHYPSRLSKAVSQHNRILVQIMLLHPGLYFPRLAATNRSMARCWILFRYRVISPVSGWLKRISPSLHEEIRKLRDAVMGRSK